MTHSLKPESGWQLSLHTSFPSDLQAEWNALLETCWSHVPFLRHEYLQAWWETRGGGEWKDASLALVTASENGKLKGIAPLFHVPDMQGRPALMLLGSIEISDFLDVIAAPQDLPPFLRQLLPFLASHPDVPAWQVLDLYNILQSSPSLPVLESAAQEAGLQFSLQCLQHSPYIPLPGDFDAYLGGIDKKQRHEIRRKMRRAEESGRGVSYYLAGDPRRLEADIQDFLALMRQDPAKDAFLTPQMAATFQTILHCAAAQGCMHLAFLEIDGQRAAGHFSFDYLNRIWAYNSGVNNAFSELSPGWVLLGYELQWANQNGRLEYDFMRGNEEYKYRFGAIDRFVLRATLQRP